MEYEIYNNEDNVHWTKKLRVLQKMVVGVVEESKVEDAMKELRTFVLVLM